MAIKTTCIGAYPKPDFVKLPDWFNHPDGPDTADPTALWERAMAEWRRPSMTRSNAVSTFQPTVKYHGKITSTIIAGICSGSILFI
jgi:hypothetical protein